MKAGLLYDTAVSKNDEEILLQIRDKDCVAIEVVYHKQCYMRYTKDHANNLAKVKKQSEESAVETATQDNTPPILPFDRLCTDIIEKHIINNEEIFSMTKLFKLFKSYGKGEVSLSTYRLKEKLKAKYPSLIFHRSIARNRSDLVYTDSITPGGVVESATVPDNISTMDESSQDEGSSAHDSSFHGFSIPTCHKKELYHSALYLRNLLLNVDTDISWPPDSENLTFKNAADVLPLELLNFLIVLLGFSDKPSFSEKIQITEEKEKKVVAIAQDLIHISTSGRTMTHKAMALGVAVRQISGSQRVIKILNQFGHCCSPDVLYKHDSALTKAISDEDVFVPRNIAQEVPSTVVWDNNDFLEETPSGKGTTHVANGIIIQNHPITDDVVIRDKIELPRNASTVQSPPVIIKPYILKKQSSPSFPKISKDNILSSTPSTYVQKENVYIIVKFCADLDKCLLPSWTGFNILSHGKPQLKSEIGYLPIIDAPVTDIETVYTILWKSKFIILFIFFILVIIISIIF